MKEIQDAEKVSTYLESKYMPKFQLFFLVQASLHGLYVLATIRFPYRDFITASGVESAGFPGQREEEIERLLHMVSAVSGSHERLLIKTRSSLAAGQPELKLGWLCSSLN
jgi:hypothetical protein